jgi:hypothetical protein
MSPLITFEPNSVGGHAIEGDLVAIIFNPIALTILNGGC